MTGLRAATHPGDLFTDLKTAGSIRDYAEPQQRAFPVIEHGQAAGSSPTVVAEAVLKIIRTETPARYYLVGPEKWYLRLSRILPPSAIESLMTRHFHLAS